MTPKEKAEELFYKYADEFNFDDTYRGYREQSKKCALIVVDEVLNTISHEDLWIRHESNIDEFIEFWQKVKQEIEKL